MATVAKRPKKDTLGYYVDTSTGKFRIKRGSNGWNVFGYAGMIATFGFCTLTDAVTYIEEGWHTL